jgi:hypothetical protein
MNKEVNNIVVYFHRNPIKNEIFYVGIGGKRRPFSKNSRTQHWYNTVNKYGYTIEIIETNLTWEEACQKEIYYIKTIGKKINGGTLINISDGGEGNVGLKHSDEYRERMKTWDHGIETRFKKGVHTSINTEFKKGFIPYNKGKGKIFGIKYICKTCSKEYISSNKNYSKTYCCRKCMCLDPEWTKMMWKSRIGRIWIPVTPPPKPVDQFDLNGNYIQSFPSMKIAEKETGANCIGRVCKGQRKTSAGYLWKLATNKTVTI